MNATTAGPQNDSAEMRKTFLLLWRKRWRLIVATALSSLLSVVVVLMTKPAYRASAVLSPAATNAGEMRGLGAALGQLGGLASLAGLNLGPSSSEVAETLAVLQSRQFLEAFIAERKLMPKLFPDQWDLTNATWKGPELEHPTPGDGFRFFNKRLLNVVQDKKTELVTISIDWSNREEAAEWANGLVDKINAEMRERAREKADASVSYLKNELNESTDVGTREAINRLIEAQVRQRMLANVTKEYAFSVVDRAAIPDLKEKVRPKPLLWILAGTLLGFMLSVGAVLASAGIAELFE
jgi:uncharacterized protein involved in exopolysaccharide biosynthesis